MERDTGPLPLQCARVSTEKGKEMGVAFEHSSDAEASEV